MTSEQQLHIIKSRLEKACGERLKVWCCMAQKSAATPDPKATLTYWFFWRDQ